ncbi:hypothetical protein [Lewinella sp. IMCC34191]|uniref:hypothetical protein n=1 Tax=Lewinella sp. IMCC34191 TaxID=2259172 RepID=UPI000E27A3E6|nr:hypothetical protein [Lewinella sp. IMCC34191]
MNLKIIDNDGFLALVDSNKYQPYVKEDWEFDQLISHFISQSNEGHMIIWKTGDEGDEWNIRIENEKTAKNSFREFEARINVTDGQLFLTEYADLTMSASYPSSKIPSKHNSDLKIHLDNGHYNVIIRQLFNPNLDYSEIKIHFEIIFTKSEINKIDKPIDKIIWFN